MVAASASVAATASRSAKVAALADLLRGLEPGEVTVAVAMLVGAPRQGRIGVGWRTIAAVDAPPAGEPGLGLLDVDRALDALAAGAGAGSAAERGRVLTALLAEATPD